MGHQTQFSRALSYFGLIVVSVLLFHTIIVVAAVVGDNVFSLHTPEIQTTENLFFAFAKEEGADKVTDHEYGHLYDSLLRRFRANPTVKLLEIGLGCGMSYGPGRSATIWQRYFPQGDIWFAEFERQCADEWLVQTTLPKKPYMLYGDQANPQTLEEWITQTNALQQPFDIIIDDGGHTWRQKTNSFRGLWKALAPGGLYFLEDLQTDYLKQYADDTPEHRPVAWIVRLLDDMWARENDSFAPRTSTYRMSGVCSYRFLTNSILFYVYLSMQD